MQNFVREVIEGLEKKLPDCEISEVKRDLTNGLVATGVMIRQEGSRLSPVIYLDNMYEDNRPVKEVVDIIVKTVLEDSIRNEKLNLGWIIDFDKVKPYLRARLYNKTTKAEVFMSAEEYGFDDLIIIPYVDVEISSKRKGSVKVTNELINKWNKSVDEVIEVAFDNMKNIVKIVPMCKYLADEMRKQGFTDVPLCPPAFDDIKVVNLSEDNGQFGAIAVIIAREQLKDWYQEGYIAVPSSIHEFIVYPNNEMYKYMPIDSFVKEVNGRIKPDEVLSNRAYKIVG